MAPATVRPFSSKIRSRHPTGCGRCQPCRSISIRTNSTNCTSTSCRGLRRKSRPMKRFCACAVLLSLIAAAPAAAQQPQKIIFDTDFAFPPQDDSMALFFVLNSPELQLLGITTVAGNRSLNVANADALKILEATNRTDIPLYSGAAAPLMHTGVEWDTKRHGGWYANEPAPAPPGGFANKKAESMGAVDFLVNTVMQNP